MRPGEQHIDRDELAACLTLLATKGISAITALRLFREHGGGIDAVRALPLLGSPSVVESAASAQVRERVARALSSIEEQDIAVVAYDDARYPQRMRDRLDVHAPLLLFAIGDVSLLDQRGVAVVGTRKPTQYGLDMADQIGTGLAVGGAVVISGLAAGIDAAAHSAALEADGPTIAVNGCGVDVIYPHENSALQERIGQQGLLVTEFLPGEPPRRHQFPHRNRIIAALSDGVVVVEAGARSGAVHTANHANDFGIEVFGVMNLMDHENFQGVLSLLKDGAEPYLGMHGLLHATGFFSLQAEPGPVTKPAAEPVVEPRFLNVWTALGREATHIDAIAAKAGLSSTDALVKLLEMELEGRATQLAGQRFVRVKPKQRMQT